MEHEKINNETNEETKEFAEFANKHIVKLYTILFDYVEKEFKNESLFFKNKKLFLISEGLYILTILFNSKPNNEDELLTKSYERLKKQIKQLIPDIVEMKKGL